MRRRTFITGLGGAIGIVALPGSAAAQVGRVPLVGVVRNGRNDKTEAFYEPVRSYMRALGWDEARNIRFEFRFADNQFGRVPALIDDLIALRPDVIVVFGDPAIHAVQRATTTIPAVAMADDLVGSGFAESLRRMRAPNMTGVSILASELDVKRLELLLAFVPNARRVGALYDPTTISTRPLLESAARKLDVELEWFEVGNGKSVASALDIAAAAKVQALNILASPVLNVVRDQIIERLRQAHLPAIYQWPETAEEGGFLAYGPRIQLCYRHIAGLMDKVLRGAQPSDLPIEQPVKFDLLVNLKVAAELGLTISAPLLLRVDQVIE